MIQALGQFVEGRDSVQELWLEEESTRLPEPGQQHLSPNQRAMKEFGSPTQGRKLMTSDLRNLRQLNLDDPTLFVAQIVEAEVAVYGRLLIELPLFSQQTPSQAHHRGQIRILSLPPTQTRRR